MRDTFFFALAYAYNGFLVAGTAYLVNWQGWSPWWFALVLGLIVTPEIKRVQP